MISFLSRPPCLSCYFFGGSVKAFALSACLISLHLDALLCGEAYFPHACLYKAFAILIGIPHLDEAFFYIFTMGCHKHRFFICLLVSLWTHLLVVCGNDRPCTMCLILSRLCWCLLLTLTLVFSSALPWLTHIILVEPTLKLSPLYVSTVCWLLVLGFVSYLPACACCEFLLILGELWSYFVHFVSKYKILDVHKSWGASLVSLEHSSAHIIISFILVARRIFGLVGSIGIFW